MKNVIKLKPLPDCFSEPLDLRGLVVEGRRIPRRGIVHNESGFVFISKIVGPVTVEYGFDTDFASIPRCLWSLFQPDGEYTEAALIHDALYWHQATAEKGGKPVSRAQADAVFLEAMEALEVGKITRQILYRGVRLGGGKPWENNQREKAGLPPPAPARRRSVCRPFK